MFKRLMRSSAIQKTLGWLVAAYMVLVKHTTRWSVERGHIVAPTIRTGQGFIALTWHSRFMMLNAAWQKNWQHPHVLISRSRDGAIVAHTARYLGLSTIRGSAKSKGKTKAKGGAQAGRDIMSALDTGGCIVITPDGPRGPRQRLGDGPIRLAKMTGAPIIPCTFSTRWRVQFKSWDKFCLPLPFGKGKIVWGTPVTVSPDADERDIGKLREQIESEMNIFLADADRAMGHAAIGPNDL